MNLECPICLALVYREWLGVCLAGMTRCACGAEIFWTREMPRWVICDQMEELIE